MRENQPLAIVGISALFPGRASIPGAAAVAGFWRDVLTGRDLIKDVPPHYWRIEDYYDPDPRAPDKVYGKRGAFLDKVDFDPLHYGIPPALVPTTDTSQLLAMMVAETVLLEAAKGQLGDDLALDHQRTCCVLGVAAGLELLGEMANRLQRPVWLKALSEHGIVGEEATRIADSIAGLYVDWKESTFPGLLGNVVTGRIANRFDLGGTNCTTDAACASSFSALWAAANELYLGRADTAITGGVDTTNDPFLYMCFSKTPALSPTGDCRPFSDEADGTMLGEGVGRIALRRLEDAERDGNRIYAVLRGIGSGSDGRAKSVYAPLATGQARTLRRAYDAAGYGPQTVELVEAHGTGTKPGDLAEFGGLREVFQSAVDESAVDESAVDQSNNWCALGSVKSQIGHTKGAAASAGLIKAALALHHKVLPPTIKVDKPSEKLNVDDSPFYINTEARPWIRDEGKHPRRASVSSFGFGGTNFHVTLEEYRGVGRGTPDGERVPRFRGWSSELLLVSGEHRHAIVSRLAALAAEYAGLTDKQACAALPHQARELAASFNPRAGARLALVIDADADPAVALADVAKRLETAQRLPASLGSFSDDAPADDGSLAFVFPGQGSQRVDMGRDLTLHFDACRAVWDRQASHRFAELQGDGSERANELALHQVVYPRPVFDDQARAANEARLRRTEWAQPGLGLTSAAMLALLEQIGVTPAFCAGHSFGEVSALHAAGVIDEDALLTVARARGERMAQAADAVGASGTMTAVSAPRERVDALLEELGDTYGPIVLANDNAPNQCAVSGTVSAIEALETRLKAEKTAFKRLPVATAFHSPLVEAAAEPFGDAIANVSFGATARATVYANATAAPYPADEASRRELLVSAIARPVRFVEQIEALYSAGARTFVEVGAGRVLSGLIGQILADRGDVRCIALDDRRDGVAGLWRAIGALAAAGHAVNLAALEREFQVAADPRAAKKPAITLAIDGANYGKPYPPATTEAAMSSNPKPPSATPKVAARPASATPSVAAGPEAGPAPTVAAGPAPTSPIVAAGPAPAAPIVAAGPTQPTPTVAAGPAAAPGWLSTYQEIQRQTAEAHANYQRLMADSHIAFLRAAEASAENLASLATGQPMVTPQPAPTTSPISQLPTIAPMPAMAPSQPSPITSAPTQPKTPAPALQPVSVPTPVEPMEEAPTPLVAEPATAPAPAATPTALDMQQLLFEVVADKTGYPAEVLRREMALESELGIDSIKRVEILSAIQEQVPALPEVDTSEMAALATLGEVLEYMERNAGELLAASPAASDVAPPSDSSIGLTTVDLEQLLLRVVADKTGYPAEVLNLKMRLESDLGIDSIKRVEILSAVQEEIPKLPEVDTAEMAALETLGEVLDYMKRLAASELAEQATPASEEAEGAAPAIPLTRYRTVLVDAPPNGFALPSLFDAGSLAVVDDGAGVADALVVQLAQRGIDAEKVTVLQPNGELHHRGAIVCAGLTSSDDHASLREANRRCFAAARALAPRLTKDGGLFVCVGDSGGDLGLEGRGGARAWAAGAAGLIKSCALEWPQASLRAIDLERGDRHAEALAAAIIDELQTGGSQLEVALGADGRRRVPQTREALQLATAGELPLSKEGAVLLVSGGGRGVTAPALHELVRKRHPRLVLLGRTPLSEPLEDDETRLAADEAALKRLLIGRASAAGQGVDAAAIGRQVARILAQRAIRQTLAELEAEGAQAARYLAVDVRDAAALSEAVAAVREEWGPIAGVIHGAGVLADKRLTDKTDEHFNCVYGTKIAGLEALLAATAQDPLELLVVFSSVAARTGNLGQSDYAMANAVLEAVAASESARRGPSCRVRALAWGPWDGGMVTPGLRRHFVRAGVPLIPLERGAALFAEELQTGGDGPVLATLGGLPLPRSGVLTQSELRSGADEARFDVLVDASSHPYLQGHRIDDVPVLPMVLVLEWLVRAARQCRPDLDSVSCQDLEVVRGVRLERFEAGPAPLSIHCRQLRSGATTLLAAEVRDDHDELRYRATLELRPREEATTAPRAKLGELAREPWPWRGDEVYREQLFHRQGFQVIRSLEGVSDDGGAAVLGGTLEMGWPEGGWQTDPAALDGGLQLAILWGEKMLGKRSLPTRVGAFHRYTDGLVRGPIHCELRGRVVGKSRTVSDITFATTEGQVVAELRDVELHTLPRS